MSVRRRTWKGKHGKTKEVWMVHIERTNPDGSPSRPIRKTLRGFSKRDAEAWERRVLSELADGTYGRREEKTDEGKVQTFEEFAPVFIAKYAQVKNKPSEVTAKELVLRVHLKPYFGASSLDGIGSYQIDSYIAAKVESGLKPKSINNHLAVLGKMLRQAKKWKLIKDVPEFDWLPVKDQPFDFLSFEEADHLLSALEKEPWRTMVLVAMRTGLRPGELRALRWQDVDFKNGRLHVRQGEYRGHIDTPKDGDAREVELSDAALAALRKHRHLRGEYVFCLEDGRKFREPAMRKALNDVCRRAGLRPLSWYVFRHTFASHLVMRGVPLKAVGELMGHSTIEMTMRYAHLSPVVRRDAVRLLDTPVSSTQAAHEEGASAK